MQQRTKTMNSKTLTQMALLTAIILLMAFTPIGYLRVGVGVEITFIMIPVVVGAILIGPGAGADAAGNYGDDGKADGHAGQGHKGGQGIAYGVGGNGGRAKAGNKGQ